MKKYIIVLFIILFTCGCDAKYKININKDLSVNEEIIGLENDEFYSNYNGKSKNWVVDALIWNAKDELNQGNYSYTYEEDNELFGEKVNKTFDSIDSYLNNNEIYKQLYNNFEHFNNKGVITLHLTDRLPINYDSLTRYRIDNAKITFVIPFKVLENNADKVDKLKNEYTWIIEKNDNKEIFIKFDSNKPLTDTINYLFYGFIIVFIIVFLVIVNKIDKRRRESNSF